jgi:hypothetical protein
MHLWAEASRTVMRSMIKILQLPGLQLQREVRMLYQTWQNHRDLKIHTKIRLRREDQLELVRSFKRSMMLQIELSEKERSQNHIPATEPSTFEEAVKQKE